ncbi:hypothetical protein [Amycolatopsis sp. NBC_00438]|uniref:hypothetical protein n=1 Tax=Amycolatopsis sp. NBC_00438 TaxID=2903558 RepID=UPI002E20B173
MSELIFIAVPGARPGKLRVVVLPRLQEPPAHNGMSDWPKSAAEAVFTVEVQLPTGQVRTIRHTKTATGQSDVWRSAFADAAVTAPAPPPVYDPPTVIPTSRDAAKVVTSFAASAEALSTPGDEAQTAVQQTIRTWDDPEPVPPPAPVDGSAPQRTSPTLDFHRTIDHLREHPTVLRALGLILELDLAVDPADTGSLPRSARQNPCLIRVTWPQPLVVPAITSPWTAYEFDGDLFVPHAAGDIRDGLLDLAGAPASAPSGAGGEHAWEFATFDVDGGAGKLRDAARASTGQNGAATMPSLRSAGLVLLHRDRAAHFDRRVRNARANAGLGTLADGTPLTAEDLVLGYRVDVKPHGEGDWWSLSQRTGTYLLADQVIEPEGGVEEGHLKANAATIDDTRPGAAGTTPHLRTDEVVARWNGWSLVTPRPSMDRSGDRQDLRRARSLPFTFDWDLRPPDGSLPPLRFGADYRIRVRVADLGGGGIEAGAGDNDGASDLIGYARFEPVPPPRMPPPPGLVDDDGVVDSSLLGHGGAIDVLVVRSDPAGTGGAGRVYPVDDERELLPPATTFEIAEQHGTLDEADDATWERAARAMHLTPDGVPAIESDEPVEPLPDPAAAGVSVFLHDIDAPAGEGQLADETWGVWPTAEVKRLKLVAGNPGGEPELAFDDGVAVVTLPPAGEATVEVSSYVKRDDLSDFAIKTYLPSVGEDLAVRGRHPMLTPARTVKLVHAVRRPLRAPAGEITVSRAASETGAVVVPPPGAALLGIDPASTAQLDVYATWSELVDNPANSEPSEEDRVVLVRSVVIGRTDTGLPQLRHDFGDTKHRVVTYRVTATSRFVRYYDEPDAHAGFVAESTLPQPAVRSTARPSPPTVLSVLPAFSWEGRDVEVLGREPGSQLTRKRLGGRVRIELGRPWFSSGRDEMLAVLTRPDAPAGDPSANLQPYYTEMARDPIYDALLRGFTTSDPIAEAHWLPAQSVVDADRPPAPVRLTEVTGAGAVAVPYAVRYENSTCFADIVLNGINTQTYSPMIRLALARYQAASLAGLELSAVVKTDPVPVLPDRSLTIERLLTGVRVTLSGLGPANGFGRTNRVDAVLERRAPAPGRVDLAAIGADSAGVPAWVRVHTVTGGLDTALPVLPVPDDVGMYRVYIREVERFFIDDSGIVREPHPGGELSERVVFADTVALR